jgi:hypothetical protein
MRVSRMHYKNCVSAGTVNIVRCRSIGTVSRRLVT